MCKVHQYSCVLSCSRWSLLFKNHSCWKHRRVQVMNGIVSQTLYIFYSCQLGCDSVRHITDNAQRHSLSADANAHHMKCISPAPLPKKYRMAVIPLACWMLAEAHLFLLCFSLSLLASMFACANCWLFHPSPQHNGKFCQGPGRLHQLCNTKPCQPNGVDFRAQQCAEYNSKPFRGWYYKWKPYTKVEGMGDIWALMHSLLTKANVSLTVGREHSKPLLWVQNPHASSFTGRARLTLCFCFF